MRKEDDSGQFGEYLGVFGLNPVEIAILDAFTAQPEMKTAEIGGKLPEGLAISPPRLYRTLKKLWAQGWLNRVSERPVVYRLCSGDQFNDIIADLIHKTERKLGRQKKAGEILQKAFEAFRPEAVLSEPSLQKKVLHGDDIPDKYHGHIAAFLAKGPLSLTKSEFNVIIALNREKVQFYLNNMVFQKEGAHTPLFGGVLVSGLNPETTRDDILSFLHMYHSNGLNFQYKLEAKGYHEDRSRILADYQFDPVEEVAVTGILDHEDAQGFQTKFKIDVSYSNAAKFHEFHGLMQSVMLEDQSTAARSVVTIWAEDLPLLAEISRLAANIIT